MASGRLSRVKGKVLDIPTVPTIGTATAGPVSASVTFTAATKGGPVSTYTALSNPGSVTGSGTSSPVTVSGLTAGTAYTFTVRGNNATGSSEYSSASNSVTPTVSTSYESISTVTVGSATSSITFSSIPATYKHLQVRAILRNTRTSDRAGSPVMRFNGDTGTNYSWHRSYGDGGSAGADSGATQSLMYAIGMATDLNTAGLFGAAIWDILDYANTNKYKSVKVLAGMDNNRTSDTGSVGVTSGSWRNTNAITSITILPNVNDWAVGSTFALYGIKGA